MENTKKNNKIGKGDYGCLMLRVKMKNWDTFLSRINPRDVYNDETKRYGLEIKPHITILFGFTDEVTVDDMKDAVYNLLQSPITYTITGASLFKNDTFEVLKLDIESETLQALNKFMRKYPHIETHPVYHPHITISYLKPNTGQKYIFKLKEQYKGSSKTFMFGAIGGKTYEWVNDKRLERDSEKKMKRGPFAL